MSLLFPKTNKLREFRYKPIFWDPEKERREAIIRRSKFKQGLLPPEEGFSSGMKGALTGDDGLRNFNTRYQRKPQSSSRLIILLIILLIIGYVLYVL